MGISKRLRYEILRRDSHTCRYCGAKAPDVEITVDHVIPRALGGTDDPSNLVSACRDCNSGKTSAHPDSPLVAGVADDALRWSAAVRVAADRMLADHAGRHRAYDQFEEWWGGWNYGFKKLPLPKPDDWRNSVDSFMSAGLPLDVLKWCVDKAGASKAAPDQTWRYMCGIAWKKVTELQQAARSMTDNPAPADSDDDSFTEGRLSLANELLGDMTDEERKFFLDSADVNEYLPEGEHRSESDEACEAVAYALNSARCNLDWLVGKIREILSRLPSGIGDPCLADMCTDVKIGDPLARMAHEAWSGLLAFEDLIDLPAATAWTYEVSEEALAEWHEYARALYPGAGLSAERWLVRAWQCAKVFAEGRHYTDMCSATGTHIPECPARGAYWAVIAELNCCGPDRAEDHAGHLVCERHLERLMDGTYAGRGGRIFTTTDFAKIPEPAAPF